MRDDSPDVARVASVSVVACASQTANSPVPAGRVTINEKDFALSPGRYAKGRLRTKERPDDKWRRRQRRCLTRTPGSAIKLAERRLTEHRIKKH